MLSEWIRVIHKNDTTYTDKSLDNANNSVASSYAIVAVDDNIFIGKSYPFNNFFALIETANENDSVMSISYSYGSEWKSTVDLLDGTTSGGATVAQSGVVQFSPNKNFTWQIVNDTSDSNNSPAELVSSALTMYNMYWLKISFSSNLSAGTEINRFSYSFTNAQTLLGIDYNINSFLTSLGSTTWDTRIMLASEQVCSILKSRNFIVNSGNVLRIGDVDMITAYKTLSLIYFNLGDDYADKRRDAESQIKKLLNAGRFSFDKNMNAKTDREEVEQYEGGLIRT